MTTPTLEQRLAVCERPNDTQVMHQRWDHLLFLHWEMPVEMLKLTLPPGLHLDTFEGKAYLGIVPFYMNGVRPVYCPTVPGLSNFLEMNLRTYVFNDEGIPGVWFYSLDADQKLAVGIARRLFHLPYQHAVMKARVDEEGWVHYSSRRAWTGVTCEFLYRGAVEPQPTEPGSLEFFLAERYLLYTEKKGRIAAGRVYHTPYPLGQAEVEIWDDNLFLLNGFHSTGRPPDFCHYSPGVSVDVFPLK